MAELLASNPMSEVLGVGIMSGNVVNVHVKDVEAAKRVRDYISALVTSPVETECARCKEHEQFRHQHRDCDKLAVALRGLYWDQVDYLTLNKLGGMNNHWMRAAREALGMDPNDTSVSPTRSELRHDSPEIQFADVFAELDKGHPVDMRDAINALWWKVGNQRRELARRAQKTSVATCDPKCFDYPRCECGRGMP